jgi:tetratricopeptide (TPR) repeat protein
MPLGLKVGAFIDLLLRGPGPRERAFAPLGADEPEDALYGVEPLRILISPLAGDTSGLAARHIQDRLSGRMGVSIAIADRPLTVSGADYNQALFVSMAVDLGRRWLKRDGADLLIWGESLTTAGGPPSASNVSWRLRFLSRATPLHPQSASLSALERLEVPALFDDATGDLVFGAALAAVNVETGDGIRARATLFRPVLKAAMRFAEGDFVGTVAQCATAQSCYAALLLLEGARTGDLKTLQRAVAVYQGALILGNDAFPEHERAMIGTHIADALSVIGDIGGRAGFGENARNNLGDRTVEYYRTALSMVRKEVFADDYAALKVRLGLALHNLAQQTGETIHLKDAADAFSAATGIWTITEAPERWADVQNSLGGLLITMGRLTHQSTLFDKAVSIFLKIADSRTRTKAPLVWATALANVGAALKEKGLAARNVECLREAAHAFEQAAQVFVELNLENNAKVVETQRAHVLQMLSAQGA